MKWMTGFIILAFLIIAGEYALLHFTGLGPVPSRFAFAGRLPSVQEGDMRRFQFFYATNRADEKETFEAQGNVLGDRILNGTFEVLISPKLPITPFVWFDTSQMNWGARKDLSSETFYKNLRDQVKDSPYQSLLVIVWGFRDWFQSAALKTAYTAYALDINTPVLLFDWPGNQGDGHRGYGRAQEISAQSAPDLGRTLAKAIRETGAKNVWIMGSSLGCQTICDALVWLNTQPDLIKGKPKLTHVVLSAPDVSANAFDEKFSSRIQTLSEHLTAYVSSNDRALLMSEWLNGGARLGRLQDVSMPPESRKGQYEFEEALELLELNANNISIVDATPINRTRNLHHFFTDSPEYFDDLYQRLIRPDAIVSRKLHKVNRRPDGSQSYWILWND